jgi:2,4-dienoyl-CoA reductase-like NADH-dependent reductase (Old Yellow Enzyme family)/thioredoxin reductase
MSEQKMNYPNLFRPGNIGSLEVPNRIVMAPMATNYAGETGGVTDALIEYYEQRARGGAGLIIAENCCVDYPLGKGGATQLRLDDDQFIPGISRLVDAVHHHGAKIAIQVNHSGPAGMASKTKGLGPVGASDINFSPALVRPRPLALDEIETIIEKFAQTVLRAKTAGFDAVELHAGHCYLIAHFMSPLTNNRTDEFGGSLEARLHLPVRIIRRCREVVGKNFPIMVRMSCDEFIEGGRGVDESKMAAQLFEAEGIAAVHVTVGTHAALHPSGTTVVEPIGYEQGWRVYISEAIKSAIDIPVITVGVIREPAFAEQVLEQGRADFIALGRSLIADPAWPAKAKQGRIESIRPCISCNEGCVRRRVFEDLPIRCAVNAEVGRPDRFRAKPISGSPKRVLVVGGGPGGMEAARVLKLRGHEATLWEKTDRLGGQVLLAAVPSFKRRLLSMVEYQQAQLNELEIPYLLNKEATPDSIKEFAPDAVVLATGAVPSSPPIPGINNPTIKQLDEVLREDYVSHTSNVTVMGGGVKGAELALFLAEQGDTVTVVEMLGQIAGDIEPVSRQDLLARLGSRNVSLLTNTKVLSCEETGLWVEDANKEKLFIKADFAVPCMGCRPGDDFAETLEGEMPVYSIGDCRNPGMIIQAIREGYEAATDI